MPVIGIDLGSLGTKVATVGRGGVTIVRNDLADRITPTLVSYTDKERLIGDAAMSTLKTNARHTVRSVSHFLGVGGTEDDKYVCDVEANFTLAPFQPGTPVKFDVGRDQPLSAVEVLVPFLKKIRAMAQNYIGANVTDCVLAVPTWFSDAHVHAALSACQLANLGCLKVMQHSTATALDYGLFRKNMFSEEARHVAAFIDIGYAQATVSFVEYSPKKLTVLCTEEDPALGGRSIDKLLVEHLLAECRKQGMDPSKNLKAMLKLEEAAEKAKKVLSANKDYTIHLECFHEDEDLNVTLHREDLEALLQPYLTQLGILLARAHEVAAIELPALASVEIIGGGTRVPAVQAALEQFFGRPVSRTLSADECVARGAAVQAAMLDPRHRVAPYDMVEVHRHGLVLTFAGKVPGVVLDERKRQVQCEGNSLLIFAERAQTNQGASRLITLPLPGAHVTRIEFDMEAIRTTNGAQTRRVISHVSLELSDLVRKAITDNVQKCQLKLKVAIDVNGMASVQPMFQEEVVTQQEVVERHPKRDEKGEIIEGEFDEVKTQVPKTIVRKHTVTLTEKRPEGFLTPAEKVALSQREIKDEQRDLSTQKAAAVRNDILSKCFFMRSAVEDASNAYHPFITEEDKAPIMAASAEYSEFAEYNDELPLEEYQAVYEKLMQTWKPVEDRYQQWFREQEEARLAAEAEAEAQRVAEENARLAAEAAAAAQKEAEAVKETEEPAADEQPEDDKAMVDTQ